MSISNKVWVIVIFSLNMAGAVTWMTDFQEEWTLQCPPNNPIKSIITDFSSDNYDRVWNISCSETGLGINFTQCEWSIYVNEFRHWFNYQCPNNGVVTGLSSYFDISNQDRRYKFLCCYPDVYVTHECQYTHYLNEHAVLLGYRFPDNFYLRGVVSKFIYNSRWDRLWTLNLCRLDQILVPLNC